MMAEILATLMLQLTDAKVEPGFLHTNIKFIDQLAFGTVQIKILFFNQKVCTNDDASRLLRKKYSFELLIIGFFHVNESSLDGIKD